MSRQLRAQHAPQSRPAQHAPPHPEPQTKPEKVALTKGATFARWRLVRDGGVLGRGSHRFAPCECVCGHRALVYEVHLLSGRSTGCGKRLCRDAWEAGRK